MAQRIDRKKWILYRHTSDFSLLVETAQILKSYSKATITKAEKERLNLRLRELGLYNERNPELPLDAINHKINQLSYYMFGYQTKIDGIDRFLFSPLGNLYLKNIDDKEKAAKIFMAMLWSVQYQHPHSGTDKEFQLYPFRLIYKLLSDRRLDCKLFAFEVSYAVVFMKEVTTNIYENLVAEILELRQLPDAELATLFQKDRHAYVNSAYEWDYYVSTFFQNAGVLNKTDGRIICSLQHGNTNTFRKITRNVVSTPATLAEFVVQLENQYSFLAKPLLLNDAERLKIDVVKEVYSFYPEILLAAIGEQDAELFSRYLELPKLIEQYANNPENETAYLFEQVLVDGFNMFYNVEAKGVGGAGHTDIECLYLTKRKKFAVESKSTANKLSGINVGRLREHREEIGGEYTIVVTPRYVPAAKRDIIGTPNVIVLASTFAEYLYNSIDNNIREIDYADFDNIIADNLGKDISHNISNLTISKFATARG
jgi:type II restriction enzyme